MAENQDQVLAELVEKVAGIESENKDLKAEMEKEKEEKAKLAKAAKLAEAERKAKAEEEDDKNGYKGKKGNYDEHKKVEAKLKSAMDEEDVDKKNAAIKEAMDEMNHTKKEEGKTAKANEEMTKKMEEQEATISTLTSIAAEPKITYLASVYNATDITEEKFTEMSASWSKMSIPELDLEIARIAPLVSQNKQLESIASTEKKAPVIPAGITFQGSAKKDDKIAKIESASNVQIFNGGVA